jgi:hypothetical protein
MSRVSLASIEVLEDLLRSVRQVQEELRSRADDRSYGFDLRGESINSSLQDASSRLEATIEEESRLRVACEEARAAVHDAQERIADLEGMSQ